MRNILMSIAAASLVVPAAAVLDSTPAYAKSKHKHRYDDRGRYYEPRRVSRTVGTLLGAAGGALLGREVDRGGMKCR